MSVYAVVGFSGGVPNNTEASQAANHNGHVETSL